MKTKSALIKSLGGYLRLGAAVGTVLLSCGLSLHARAASGSPVGTWDVVISGSRQGLAVMQFSDGGTPDTRTFSIYEIIVPKKVSFSSSSDDSRNATGDDSRSGTSSGSSTPSVITFTNLFGEEFVLDGKWSFDVNGKIIGVFGEALAEVCTPETFTVTSQTNFPDGSIGFTTNTITITNCVGITNGVSFIGTAVSNKSLTLTGHAFSRPFVFSGLPVITTLTNISGNYYGTRVAGGLSSVEFLTLSPSTLLPPGFNVYDVRGAGGGYSYNAPGGHALLSRRGKIAFAIPFDPDGSILRATVGGFDLRRLRFNTQGVEQSDSQQQNNFIRFNGAVSP
jgi:hypothetical protein